MNKLVSRLSVQKKIYILKNEEEKKKPQDKENKTESNFIKTLSNLLTVLTEQISV